MSGSNGVEAWTTDIASLDATNEFLRLARKHVLNEAEFMNMEGLSLLVAKAEQIERHFADDSYSNKYLRWKEEREFWEIADKYGIEKELARSLLNDVIPKEPPPFGPSYPLYWVLMATPTVGGSIVAALTANYLMRKGRPTFKPKRGKSQKKKSMHLHYFHGLSYVCFMHCSQDTTNS